MQSSENFGPTTRQYYNILFKSQNFFTKTYFRFMILGNQEFNCRPVDLDEGTDPGSGRG